MEVMSVFFYRKTNTVLPWFIRGFPMPKEGVVSFPDGATVSQSSLLQAGNVDIQSEEFPVDNGSLACVVDLLQVSSESRTHGPNVPACKTKSWSLLSSLFLAWCGICGPLVEMNL
jgi:hypothetical protein